MATDARRVEGTRADVDWLIIIKVFERACHITVPVCKCSSERTLYKYVFALLYQWANYTTVCLWVDWLHASLCSMGVWHLLVVRADFKEWVCYLNVCLCVLLVLKYAWVSGQLQRTEPTCGWSWPKSIFLSLLFIQCHINKYQPGPFTSRPLNNILRSLLNICWPTFLSFFFLKWQS